MGCSIKPRGPRRRECLHPTAALFPSRDLNDGGLVGTGSRIRLATSGGVDDAVGKSESPSQREEGKQSIFG